MNKFILTMALHLLYAVSIAQTPLIRSQNNADPSVVSSIYLDPAHPIDDRVNDLISQMTLNEKLSQLGNQANAISRLTVPAYDYWSEALHGVARAGLATSFPQAIGLSSTWNPDLIYRIATAISDEARVKNNLNGKGLVYWSPTINMARDPRWGRGEENYGEDVYLTSKIAIQFIRGMQGNDPNYLKTVATAKHFAANNVEENRYGISSNMDERSLREYYLPAFKACVKEAGVYSIMSAYNAVNTAPCSANRTLLQHILRDEWGFEGFVVSDCDAVNNVWNNHHYVTTAADATALSLLTGTDLNCGSTYPQNASTALAQGIIEEEDIDIAVHRILKSRFLLGEFDPKSMVPYTAISDTMLDCEKHRQLALEAAREAIVLLKNDNSFLPLNSELITKIAVIGPNANQVQLGGYSGSPSVSISPLQAIGKRFGVEYQEGYVQAENFSSQFGIQTESCAEGGENIGYIQNQDYTIYNGVELNSAMDLFEVRIASNTAGGNLEVHLDSLNGELLGTINITNTGGWQNWVSLDIPVSGLSGTHAIALKFTGGSEYLFNMNWFRFIDSEASNQNEKVLYTPGCNISTAISEEEMVKAVQMAESADVVVLVCGTDLHVADESRDRSSIGLPGVQHELIERVYAANPNTVLVLVTGFSLAINQEQDSIPAIITAWYDGQAQGTAIADVLFGDYNPGGKLTTTWYKSLDDLPDMHDYDIKNNRTYMYYTGEPLYPFGHGLSYTSFSFDSMQISSPILATGDSLTIVASITNTGTRSGDEVVQLYVSTNSSEFVRPKKELKGFERIHLNPGQSKKVTIRLKHQDLGFYDPEQRAFFVESGTIDLLLGSSSENIQLSDKLTVEGGLLENTYRQYPDSIIQAEQFEKKSLSVQIKSCSETTQSVEFSKKSEFIAFKNMLFNEDEQRFTIRCATQTTGNFSFEIRLDSVNGQLAGTVLINESGNLNVYTNNYADIISIKGLHDVYLLNTAGNGLRSRVNWFSFSEVLPNGLKNELNTDQLKVFPNPVKDVLNFTGFSEFEVVSLTGNSLMKGKGRNADVSRLTSGVYLLRTPSRNFVFIKE